MTDSIAPILLFTALCFLLGVYIGSAPFSPDTFTCTNACGGAHNIERDKKCFCAVETP